MSYHHSKRDYGDYRGDYDRGDYGHHGGGGGGSGSGGGYAEREHRGSRDREFRDRDYHYDSGSNHSGGSGTTDRKRKRKSRWGGDESEKIFIPGMPTIIPSNLTKNQEEIYILQLQIESITRRLLTGDLGIPDNPEERSPSPEPIYNTEGKRLNTREYRTRKRFEDERHSLVQKMCALNAGYKPPPDYKPPQTKICEKVIIPQEEYPDINFVGLIIGPRGNTLKGMERDTSAKIIIRGKGSVKEGKVARKDGQPMPGEDEPLHAFVSGPTTESVVNAVAKIKEVIRKGIELPENLNDLRRSQLRELALLNGTLRENDGPRCHNCGSIGHRSWQCPDKPNVTNNVFCTNCNGVGHLAKDCKEKGRQSDNPANKAKIDEEYLSLMAELGEGPPPSSSTTSSSSNNNHHNNSSHSSTHQAPMRTASSSIGPGSSSSSHNPANNHNPGESSGGWSNGNTASSSAPSDEHASNGSAPANAWQGYYDPYSAAYAQMSWDPNAWAAASQSTPSGGQPSGSDSTQNAAAGGYDAAQWAAYAQWYAQYAATAGTSGAVPTGGTQAPVAPPMFAPPPPPPPPPQH